MENIPPELLQQFLQMLLSTNPDSVDYGKDAYNWMQDQNDLMADPIMALFGGAGTVDPYAFAPVQTGAQEFDVPTNPLQPYLSLDPTSEEGFIATAVAAGKSPEQAVAMLAEKNALYKNDPDAAKRARELASNLFSGYSQYDQQMSTLPDMVRGENGSWQYQGQGQIQGGRLTVPVMGQSEAAKRYTDLGLPTPVDQFSQADFGFGQDGQDRLTALKAMREQLLAGGADVERLQQKYKNDRANDLQALELESPSNVAPRMFDGPDGNYVSSNRQRALQGTDPGFDQSMREGADRARNGQPGLPSLEAFRNAQNNRNYALRGNEEQSKRLDFDRRYAEQMANMHQQAGITPLSLVAMQRAMALKQRGA